MLRLAIAQLRFRPGRSLVLLVVLMATVTCFALVGASAKTEQVTVHGTLEADSRAAYDLLVRARELPAAVDAVRALPGLRFVLDHIAKPRIADGRDDPWRQGMPVLAAQPNVAVKLSGMVTEADWATWTPRDLRPFVEDVVGWFGVGRLMFGSDWPVCLLAGSYHAVLGGLISALPALSPGELDSVLGLNAVRTYQLDRSSAVAAG